jgi:hypothetical protein
MRRNRMRSVTIDAEDEEDFIQQYEKSKSRLSQLNFKKNEIQEKIPEDEDDDLGYQKKKKSNFITNDSEEGDYSDLGALNNDDDEELLGVDYENDDIIKDEEDIIIKKENSDEKGIEVLVTYLKNTISYELKNMDFKGNTLIFNKNKNIMSMSGNAIDDLNIPELIDNILAENDNEYIKPTEGNNNSLRDYIFQNIESDSTLKIMVMSNNKNTKKSFMNKFFEIKKDLKKNDNINEIKENENDEIDLDEPLEIRKKQIKLFNKTVSLQIFDTSDEFHQKSNTISDIYYQKVSAFFIFIESSNHNTKKYLDFIFEKINKYINNKTVVIFGVNMLFKKDCTIDGDNLREYSNEKDVLYIPININNFDLKNCIINNLFNLILIKGIDHKINIDHKRKGSKDRRLGGIKNKLKDKICNDSNEKNNKYDLTKMNVPSSLGYKKKYRIKHVNAFDIEDDYDKKNKRKLSIDI